MSRKQAEWAGRHEWYISSHVWLGNYRVVVWCNDSGTLRDRTFDCYEKLQAWAGY
jgi:hypothetical protein